MVWYDYNNIIIIVTNIAISEFTRKWEKWNESSFPGVKKK